MELFEALRHIHKYTCYLYLQKAAFRLGYVGVREELPEDHGAGVRHHVHLQLLHELGLLPADPGD